MTICSANIIAIDATIGKSSEFSCDEPSSMFATDLLIVDTL